MYVTLLLLSLVVFGSCHHGDNDDHLHDELDEMRTKLDRLTAKLQNAADTLNKRKENHDEADRKSRNMLIRLDRLRLNDGTDHCPEKYFKCATVTQCVANILVCDKVPDCADKSDEDENLCKMVNAGDWYGTFSHYNCTSTESQPSDMHMKFSILPQRSHLLPGVAKVSASAYWTYRKGEVRSYDFQQCLYNIGNGVINSPAFVYGGQMSQFKINMLSESVIEYVVRSKYSGEFCGLCLLRREGEEEFLSEMEDALN